MTIGFVKTPFGGVFKDSIDWFSFLTSLKLSYLNYSTVLVSLTIMRDLNHFIDDHESFVFLSK